MKFECIKGMATPDNVSVVVMQGDWVELVSTDEGEVLVNGVAGWCNGFELTFLPSTFTTHFRVMLKNKQNSMSQFEENNPEQLRKFLTEFRMLIDEYHPNIYTMNDLFRGVHLIEIAILDKLNNPNSQSQVIKYFKLYLNKLKNKHGNKRNNCNQRKR